MPPNTIVAEISKNWTGAKEGELASGLLSQRFEAIIATNAARGYRLDSWQFQQACVPTVDEQRMTLVETIIAVFVKTDSQSQETLHGNDKNSE